MLPAAVERWRPLATQAAAHWGSQLGVNVPVAAVLGIIAKESHGDPNAFNRSDPGGSRGLMQVGAATASDLGITNQASLFTPSVGVWIGTHYLAKKLKAYGGQLAPAVAAYNAGSARFGQDERYVNQGYVDEVIAWIARAASAVTSHPAATGGGLLLLGGLALLAFALRPSRPRRAA